MLRGILEESNFHRGKEIRLAHDQTKHENFEVCSAENCYRISISSCAVSNV